MAYGGTMSGYCPDCGNQHCICDDVIAYKNKIKNKRIMDKQIMLIQDEDKKNRNCQKHCSTCGRTLMFCAEYVRWLEEELVKARGLK